MTTCPETVLWSVLLLTTVGCVIDTDKLKVPSEGQAPNLHWTAELSPTFATLGDIWGDELVGGVWAVGHDGTIVSFDGEQWQQIPSGTQASLSGVWGTRYNDAWAVGCNGVLRWEGSSWTSVNDWCLGPACDSTAYCEPQLDAVWGISSDDVWIAGALGPIEHWINGQFEGAGLLAGATAIWGSSSTDVWFLGSQGQNEILRWNGSTLDFYSLQGSYPQLLDVWGLASDDVWAVGLSGTILHWGGTWQCVLGVGPDCATSATNEALYSVWGASSNDIWAVGENGIALHWNGASWTIVETGTTRALLAVGGIPNTGYLWAVGEEGTILRLER